MVLASFDWQPSRRFYRVFGLSLALTGAAIGGVLWWRLGDPTVATVVAGAAALCGLVAVAAPQSWPARIIYWGVALPAFGLGTVLSSVLVGLVYYVVVTSIGLLLRALGKDPLGLRGHPDSFWRDAAPAPPDERYERQF